MELRRRAERIMLGDWIMPENIRKTYGPWTRIEGIASRTHENLEYCGGFFSHPNHHDTVAYMVFSMGGQYSGGGIFRVDNHFHDIEHFGQMIENTCVESNFEGGMRSDYMFMKQALEMHKTSKFDFEEEKGCWVLDRAGDLFQLGVGVGHSGVIGEHIWTQEKENMEIWYYAHYINKQTLSIDDYRIVYMLAENEFECISSKLDINKYEKARIALLRFENQALQTQVQALQQNLDNMMNELLNHVAHRIEGSLRAGRAEQSAYMFGGDNIWDMMYNILENEGCLEREDSTRAVFKFDITSDQCSRIFGITMFKDNGIQRFDADHIKLTYSNNSRIVKITWIVLTNNSQIVNNIISIASTTAPTMPSTTTTETTEQRIARLRAELAALTQS
jgi:hypothetical protein